MKWSYRQPSTKRGTFLPQPNDTTHVIRAKVFLKRTVSNQRGQLNENMEVMTFGKYTQSVRKTKPNPEDSPTALFRLTTGCLAAHLFRLGIYCFDKCTPFYVDRSKINGEHILLCLTLKDASFKSPKNIVQLYWDAREIKDWIPGFIIKY